MLPPRASPQANCRATIGKGFKGQHTRARGRSARKKTFLIPVHVARRCRSDSGPGIPAPAHGLGHDPDYTYDLRQRASICDAQNPETRGARLSESASLRGTEFVSPSRSTTQVAAK